MSKLELSKKIIKLSYIMSFILLFCSFGFIFLYFYDGYNMNKQRNLLNEISLDNSLPSTFNNVENLEEDDKVLKEKTERMKKLEKLQNQNSDIVAWIEIENTNINYPVLQGNDNKYYLDHNYKKKYSVNGSIFLDKDYHWDPQDSNLLIYGHHSMFKTLLKYKDKKYYDKHPYIRVTTSYEDSNYEIISVFKSKVYYKSDKNVFRYYYFINAKDENEYNEFVENSKKASLYDTGKSANYNDQLITLSTCSYHTKDGRFVIVAKRSKE